MEETVEAAATLIESKCGELVAKARRAEEAAVAADVDCADLTRVAQELEEAGEEGRIPAVAKLRDAASALVGSLEGAARDQLHALRAAAANLTRSMNKMQRAKEEEGADGRRVRGSWWRWLICRRHGLRQNLDVEEGVRPEETVDRADVAITVDLLSQGTPQLLQRAVELVAQARAVADAANGAHVPSDQLLSATNAFEHAGAGDLAALLKCIGDLSTAANAVEEADSAPLKAVRDRAAQLERAADALVRVQPAIGQGDQKRYSMARLALQGSLTLITYLGPNLVAESVKKLSQDFRWWFNVALCSWWTFQAAEVPCSAYARSLPELWILQILCRLGMLGINLFVIFFVNLALNVKDDSLLWVLLISASIIHFASFVWAACRGDLIK